MTARDFCYWLQGHFEMQGDHKAPMSERQVDLVRQHLALVFIHEIDPSAGPPAHQAKLDAVHHGMAEPVKPTIGGTRPDGTMFRC